MIVKVLPLLFEGGTFFPWEKNESAKHGFNNSYFIETIINKNLV